VSDYFTYFGTEDSADSWVAVVLMLIVFK